MAREYYCNKCGEKMDEFDVQEQFAVYQRLGYGSKYDGERVEIDLCCNCFDKLIEECKISPIIHTQPDVGEART